MRGARAVDSAVLKAFPAAEMAVMVVWLDVLPTDNAASAAKSATAVFDDSRVTQFHDAQQTGHVFAAAFGHPEQFAWDSYLFYAPGVQWDDLPPLPAQYWHQLTSAPAEFAAQYRTGAELETALHDSMQRMLSPVP